MRGVILQKIKYIGKRIRRMSIQLFKRDENTDADLKEYEKNLFRHRLRNLALGAGLFGVVILCGFLLWKSVENRTYDNYEVVKSYERTDTMTTQYTEFLKYVLKYSKDGISCVDHNNNPIWSQTYNMQNPIIHVRQNSVAVAEENGTEALIFDASGIQGTIQTRLPIRQISVSSQGVLAALLEDGDVMRLKLYDKKGKELVDAKFELQDVGYPLRMSLSADATKLAVAFLQVQDGSIGTCLAFYNFSSVGENQEDRLVASKILKGIVMPKIEYMDSTHCFALGTNQLLLYEGAQIPELKKEIELEKEVISVFHSERYIGLVMEGEEQRYCLQVYDLQGSLQFTTEFDMDYRVLKFSGDHILIYNEFEGMMINHNGKIFFTGTFEESISNLYTQSGNNRFIVMHASRTDQIKLK